MKDRNSEGKVYGFVTTGGEQWQTLEYDDISFQMSGAMMILFGLMRGNRKRWFKENYILVDRINFALGNRSIVGSYLESSCLQ